MRPILVLVWIIAYFAQSFAVRSALHRRATGSWGFHGISGARGSAAWWGGVLLVVGALLILTAPLFAWGGIVPLSWRPTRASDLAGALLALAGAAGTWWSQSVMGASWRIGVRQEDRTALVTAGPFRWVRNPIFSSVLLAAAGSLLLLPTAMTLAAVVCLGAAIELQVRVVEEPYLHRVHGEAYRSYARRVGRFVPKVGQHS